MAAMRCAAFTSATTGEIMVWFINAASSIMPVTRIIPDTTTTIGMHMSMGTFFMIEAVAVLDRLIHQRRRVFLEIVLHLVDLIQALDIVRRIFPIASMASRFWQ